LYSAIAAPVARVQFLPSEIMSKPRKAILEVQGTAVTVLTTQGDDFMSLTDMLKAKDGEFFISDWLRNRNTVEFLSIWESVHNADFNYGEFAIIKSQAGLNSYKISVKEWVEKTNAIGLKASAGRYGGTYAHRDIAFEFGMWISPEFKVYLRAIAGPGQYRGDERRTDPHGSAAGRAAQTPESDCHSADAHSGRQQFCASTCVSTGLKV
jgi:hypothetical protein